MSQSILFEGLFAEARDSADGQVLENCLLCGKKSLNGYDLEGSFGDSAKVTQLYEGVPVFLDHDAQGRVNRGVRELAGVVKNARLSNGVPRGDLVTSSTTAGEELRKLYSFASKNGVRAVGLSHVARYKFNTTDRTRVESVDQVFSVDVVVHPATTKGFKESKMELNQDERAELEALRAEKALGERRRAVEAELKREGLNPADSVVCSAAFMSVLLCVEDAGERQSLIKDRAGVVKSVSKSAPTSQERQSIGTQEFDAVEFLKSVPFVTSL